MSILIKGAEMPSSCAACPCCDDEVDFCRAAKEFIPMLGKPKFCPLVEIPPHGRLINVDKLLERIKRDLDTKCIFNDEEKAYQSAVEDAEFIIDCAPTVIESEEQEHE